MKNKKINKNKDKKGFTLIELIVVVTIIAVLTVVGTVSYSSTSRKSRDSRRMSDLEKIRLSLELYRQSVGTSYPSSVSSLVPTYLSEEPKDPKTSESYSYGNSGFKYYLCAAVENAGSTTTDVTSCSGSLPVGYAGYYKITNP